MLDSLSCSDITYNSCALLSNILDIQNIYNPDNLASNSHIKLKELFDNNSEIIAYNAKIEDYIDDSVKGIILSGGPSTVTKKNFPSIPKHILSKKIPILGICYGLQLIAKLCGGKIKSSKKKESLEEHFYLKKRHHY